MKADFQFFWNDATKRRGYCPRERAAYLLRAARSRGECVVRSVNGYKIGRTLFLLKHRHYFSPRRANGSVEFCQCGKWRFAAEYIKENGAIVCVPA